MWQITWMLGFLPDWFWSLLLILGVLAVLAAWVLKFIPFVRTYRLPLNVGGVLAVIISVWFLGAASNEEKWQARVKELEEKISKAETESAAANKTTEVKVVEKVKVIKGKTEYIKQYLDREVVKKEEIIKYVEQCPVPRELIELHNQATELNKAQEVKK